MTHADRAALEAYASEMLSKPPTPGLQGAIDALELAERAERLAKGEMKWPQ